MGTWSRPLFVSVSSGSPSDYKIDLSKFTQKEIDDWSGSAFFLDIYDNKTKVYNKKTIWTLEEFMNTGCESHRLLDHMTNRVIRSWLMLFCHILTENPTLDNAQFHFFCTDSQEPYYFDLRRESIENIDKMEDKSLEFLPMYIGRSKSSKYFKPNPNYIPYSHSDTDSDNKYYCKIRKPKKTKKDSEYDDTFEDTDREYTFQLKTYTKNWRCFESEFKLRHLDPCGI
jgi:hypothetical protein